MCCVVCAIVKHKRSLAAACFLSLSVALNNLSDAINCELNVLSVSLNKT